MSIEKFAIHFQKICEMDPFAYLWLRFLCNEDHLFHFVDVFDWFFLNRIHIEDKWALKNLLKILIWINIYYKIIKYIINRAVIRSENLGG